MEALGIEPAAQLRKRLPYRFGIILGDPLGSPGCIPQRLSDQQIARPA